MSEKKQAMTDMVKTIADESGVFEYQVKAVLKSLVKNILTRLANGETVHVLALGKFWLKKRKATNVWNPVEKAKSERPERFVPKFTYGQRAYYFIREEANKLLRGEQD